MPFQLRKYQARGNNDTLEAFNDPSIKAVCCCMPTGSGKTVSFANLTFDLINNMKRVLILCNRIELIDQANDKLKKNGLKPTLIIPGYRNTVSTLYLGSVDTLRNYPIPEIDYLFVDECHIRDFDEIVLECKMKGVKVVGFTATPCRTGKRLLHEDSFLYPYYPMYTGQMGDVYDTLIAPVTITELLQGCEEGYTYLVPEITFSAQVDTSQFKVKNTKDGEDFSEADQFSYFNTPQMYGGTVDKYIKHGNGKQAICYCVNVKASIAQCEEFNKRGIPAVHIDGSASMKKHRKQIFKDFQAGVYKVLCNVAVATTGNDMPTVEVIIIDKITMSLSLWLQMCGRGGRLCPEIGKTHFILIDMGGNVYRHGFWSQERDWSLDIEFMSNKKGVASVRECEKCEALIFVAANTCPYCGIIQEKKKEEQERKAQELADAEFSIIESAHIPAVLKIPLNEMTVKQLEEFRELKGYTIAWIVRQLMYREDHALYDYAALKNYSSAWVRKQRAMSENNKEQTTNVIWEFIQKNTHLTDEYVQAYALKKLKVTHSVLEIENIMPKILAAAKSLRTVKV